MTSKTVDEQAKMLIDQALATEKSMGLGARPTKDRYQRAVNHAATAIRQLAEASAGWTEEVSLIGSPLPRSHPVREDVESGVTV